MLILLIYIILARPILHHIWDTIYHHLYKSIFNLHLHNALQHFLPFTEKMIPGNPPAYLLKIFALFDKIFHSCIVVMIKVVNVTRLSGYD